MDMTPSSVRKKLFAFDSPFLWNPRSHLETCPDNMIDKIMKKIDDDSTETELEFDRIMLLVILSYEYFVDKKLSDALRTVEAAEAKLTSPELADVSDSCLKKLSVPMLHIILTTKAHVLADHEKELQKVLDVTSRIPVISSSDVQNVAALIGLRAVFYSYYGICGMKKGLELATDANNKNPEESLWYYLKGRYMGVIRKDEKFYDMPTEEEIKLLERAMKLEQNAVYMVFTAHLYRETAHRTYCLHRNDSAILSSLKKETYELNKESQKLMAMELKPNCVRIILRCIGGLIKFPPPFGNNTEIKELLEKILNLVPDSGHGHHLMAQYYERREKNYELAINHLKMCEKQKIFGACLDLLRLEYMMDEKLVDPIARLNQMREDFPHPNSQCQILSHLASYYIFINPDLLKACEYISACIPMNSKCFYMKYHRPLFLMIIGTCNLFHVAIDEIKIRLRDTICSSEEREIYQAFLNELRETGIDIPVEMPQNLKQSILDKSEELRSTFLKKSAMPPPGPRASQRPSSRVQSEAPQPLSWRRRV